eukprot:CAMPEP_0184522260 /NCGR_PEP_ID=MMETSP0198_2-20121128/8186_1 /TAXON_ID=1112570 /ORGANISM="Thraustochytrium sp., Strain LLF1b" /LENGTH=219 /DNA_ID=CAMNT_0026913073 /DNA_START=55 /DNA_END=714 /DNA_ORIENTATION=-
MSHEDEDMVHVVQGKAPRALLTHLRDVRSDGRTFATYVDRACTVLAEEAIAQDHLVVEKMIKTPCGECTGYFSPRYDQMCAVSIMRSGDLVLEALRRLEPGIPVGKILIQRDESDAEKKAILFYSKLPPNISELQVLLVDPMIATAGSAIKAIEVLTERDVNPADITFVNMIASPEGIAALRKAYPQVHIVTLAIDEYLNENKYIVPGLGDCGDRAMQT